MNYSPTDGPDDRDGAELEARALIAICTATKNAFPDPISCEQFLLRLFKEVQSKSQKFNDQLMYSNDLDVGSVSALFSKIKVKFHFPIPRPEGGEFKDPLDGNHPFSFLYRPRNKEKHDIRTTQNGIFSGECKNRNRSLDATLLEEVVSRFPKKSLVHFLFCGKLANFQSKFFIFPIL